MLVISVLVNMALLWSGVNSANAWIYVKTLVTSVVSHNVDNTTCVTSYCSASVDNYFHSNLTLEVKTSLCRCDVITWHFLVRV
jgi:hypothetical protein